MVTPSAAGRRSTAVTVGRPYVSVPVLSKIIVRTVGMRSSADGSLTMMPLRAAREIAPTIATGTPMSSGQGVAMTSTARNRLGSPLTIQPSAATMRAITV